MNTTAARAAATLVLIALIAGRGAVTQTTGPADRPDPLREPTYGRLRLRQGFYPDPHYTNVLAGGDVNLEQMGHLGFVAEAPDLTVSYESGDSPLSIYVSHQTSDTILLVLDPAGVWHHNDDAVGSRPGLHFPVPLGGAYRIWVGTYGPAMVHAEIAISEMPWGVPGGGRPDRSRSATHGSLHLSSGYDELGASVMAGGRVDLETLGYRGYGSEAPDLFLTHDGGGSDLFIHVSRQDADTVLLVADPGGVWHFNDDAVGLRPGVRIEDAAAGEYAIWVGTFGPDVVRAEVTVARRPWVPGPEGARAPVPTLAPAYGSAQIGATGTASLEVDVVGGGVVSLSPLGYHGYVAAAPDFSIELGAGPGPLHISVRTAGDDDSVLLVREPDGKWLFNDDAGGMGTGSGISLPEAAGGKYGIWVGSYDGSFIDTTLVISRLHW